MLAKYSVAIIGSFKQHNLQVQEACIAFRASDVIITSPLGHKIIQDGIPFVRFESDSVESTDPEIQLLALHRILRADLVFVVAPNGYVGKTTCYEIGRVIQSRKPIYFSAAPEDLPVYISPEFIGSAAELIQKMLDINWKPQWLFERDSSAAAKLERELLEGAFRND